MPGPRNSPNDRSSVSPHPSLTGWLLGACRGLLVWLMLTSNPPPVLASAPPGWFHHDPDLPWHITADEVSQNRATGTVTASGDVIITHKGKRLSAHRVRFNQKTLQLSADGNVVLAAEGDILTGDRIDIDLRSETGVLINATLISQETRFRITGKRIEKLDKNRYRLEEGSITTCEGDRPAWRITCRSMQVTVEGYGIARDAALRVLEVPVMGSPILAFPVKIARQTGLLVPQFGTSDRKGWEFNQPLFWAINDTSDATIYWNHMQDRGEKLGAEYRYAASDTTLGALMLDGFNDRQIDDGTSEAARKWGYPDDGYDRTNEGRFWFRMKHDIDFGDRMTAKLDADVVSDPDYLKEFENGYSGYNDTNGYFLAQYGRGLDDKDDPDRLNLASFNKTWSRTIATADARWYDSAVDRSQGLTRTTLQKMPDLTLAGVRQPVFTTPLVVSGFGRYVNFYREQGQTGHRVDIYPRVHWPLAYRHYLQVEPSAGFRETIWYMDGDVADGLPDTRSHARGMADFQVAASSDMDRVFDAPGARNRRWRHLIRPEVVYDYVPKQDQQDLPYFDETDRIAALNRVTYALTNTLTSGGSLVTAAARNAPAATGQAAQAATTYHQLARLKIEQSFDINAAGESDPEPFSPVYGELTVTPVTGVSGRFDGNWSIYDADFVDRNIRLEWVGDHGERFSIEHRYTRSLTESLFAAATFAVWDGVKVYGSIERDVKNDTDISNQMGVLLDQQCWSLDTRYKETPTDREISFLITLRGLGGFGSGFNPGSLSGGN